MDATLITIIAIIVLLLLSAFFSGSETALTAASRPRMFRLGREGSRRALTVQRLIRDKETLIGGILLGNNLVNILASALATSLFLNIFGEEGVAYATLTMTALVLIFSEVLPKTYAISKPDRLALLVATPISIITKLFAPVVALVKRIVRFSLRLAGIDIDATQNVLSAHEEIRGVVEMHADEGGLVKSHRDMLGSILDLDDVSLEDVVVHRSNMVTIDAGRPAREVIEEIVASPFTRFPLWRGNSDNIIGILNAKDVLRALHAAAGDADKIDLAALAAPPWFVPETTTLREQLAAFLERRAHVALVVDEYGALMGLVTLEDIIEEIVGDITDEHDRVLSGVRRRADGGAVVDGSVHIRDLNRKLDWSLPDQEAATIAGLVMHVAERIPAPGDSFAVAGYRLEVVRRKRNRITLVRVTPPRPDAD